MFYLAEVKEINIQDHDLIGGARMDKQCVQSLMGVDDSFFDIEKIAFQNSKTFLFTMRKVGLLLPKLHSCSIMSINAPIWVVFWLSTFTS